MNKYPVFAQRNNPNLSETKANKIEENKGRLSDYFLSAGPCINIFYGMFWIQAKLIAFAASHSTGIQSRLLIQGCLQQNVAPFKISPTIDRAANAYSQGCSLTPI